MPKSKMKSEGMTLKRMKSRLRKNASIQFKVVGEGPNVVNSVHSCDEDNVPLIELPRLRKSEDSDQKCSSPGSCDGKKSSVFLNINEPGRSTPKVRYYRQRNSSTMMKKNESICNVQSTSKPKANLALLGINTLWRYWRYFNLGNFNPNPSEEEMFNAVQQHFVWQQLEETEVIGRFINAAKRLRMEDERGKEDESLHDQYLVEEWVQA